VRFVFRFLMHALVLIVILTGLATAPCQNAPAKPPGANPADPEGILRQLAPDDTPPPQLALKAVARARAIRLLAAVKRDETGWRRQLAVYLLATLGQDYELNRNDLLRIWRGCVVPYAVTECDEGTGELLMLLYNQGHPEFLQPLLAGGNGYQAALSEELGVFYSDQLEKNPRDFLTALATFPPRRQRDLCIMAGEGDGGGMGPKINRKVLANLKEISGEVADRCTRGVREGNRSAEEADEEEQKEIQRESQPKQNKK